MTLRLVPLEVRDQLHRFVMWSLILTVPGGRLRSGLLVAYRAAGGPCPRGDRPFLGKGAAVIRTGLVGRWGRNERPFFFEVNIRGFEFHFFFEK